MKDKHSKQPNNNDKICQFGFHIHLFPTKMIWNPLFSDAGIILSLAKTTGQISEFDPSYRVKKFQICLNLAL